MRKWIETEEVELMPDDDHKSFYKKAFVEVAPNGVKYLRSYDTIIAKMVNGKVVERYWDAEKGYQNTTLRHIKAFCDMNKKEFMAVKRVALDVLMDLPEHKNNAGKYWDCGRFWR